jgi:hypothetical protein
MPVFETPGSVALKIRIPSGRVHIATADQPKTEVELVPVGRRGQESIEDVIVRADERGGGHVITVEQRDRVRWGPLSIHWGADVEVRVTCPPDADLDLSGASTEFDAEGRYGHVAVKTASGDVRLGTIKGKLQVKTASGDVAIDAIESEGSVVTVSGDLTLERVDAPFNVRSVSGDAELGVVREPVSMFSTSGDIEVRAVSGGEVRVQTVSGDARLAVARGTRVWIDATSVSGDLGSELSVGDESTGEASGETVPLHVKTVSGDVSIVRAAGQVTG